LSHYHCNLTDAATSIPTSPIKPKFPLSSVLTYTTCNTKYKQFCLSVSSTSEPSTYTQALQDPNWLQAMKTELQALKNTNTWTIVDLPPHKTPIGCKWVYKIKYLSDGSIDRYTARLVAKGYTQQEGVDYFDTFSPVAKLTTVRTLLSLASIQNWHLEQLDVNNVFLHGDLQEEVYMTIPKGYTLPHLSPNTKVCKLNKSIYGLKQASRQWYSKLSETLTSLGYHHSTADHSLFTKFSPNNLFTALLVYVDDIVLTGNDVTEICSVKALLHSKFCIKDLGPLRYFLGLEVARSTSGILLNQRNYTLDLLSKTGMLASKPSPTPYNSSIKLICTDSPLFHDITQYRRLIGQLLYLTTTRPDISFAVQQLSQFVSQPTDNHFKAAMRILQYLKLNPAQGLFYPSNSDLVLSGFADSDWATCPTTRRSTTGFAVFLGKSLISWKSKKQTTVSRSSSEVEYRALAALTCEIQWLHYLFNDLHIKFTSPTSLYCDNRSAVYLAHNPAFNERSKHIEIDCHIVREKLETGLIKLFPIPSTAQLADFFTKPLAAPAFSSFIVKLGLMSVHSPACGGVLENLS
jgi:hypothetical protein